MSGETGGYQIPNVRVEFVNGYAHVEFMEAIGRALGELDEYWCTQHELPPWIARRIAVLSTMSFDPPTEAIGNVGRRMDEFVYWIYAEEAANGDDPREES